jgi:hypothetical protein
MNIEYKNPEKREGIFVWEADVNFFPESKNSSFSVGSTEERLRTKYGEGLYFPSLRKEDNFLLWISEIKNWDSQKVLKTSYNLVKKKTYEDKENENLITIFDFSGNIVGRKQLKINFTCESFEVKVNFDNISIADYKKTSPLYQKYTKTERLLSQTDEIVAMADEITREKSNYIVKAKMIYEWMIENVALKNTNTENGAIRTFQNRKGNSGEISFLFTTLMRSVGIPTRIVTGAWGAVEKRQEFHFWTEFYVQDIGWVPVDCVKKLFGELDNKRTIFSKGENIFLERGPEHGENFKIKYKRAPFMQPEIIYADKDEEGFFAIKENKYILIK